jgi:NAD(P)-dependent dehydrogenase (short-subunit alcohol dehydrogenase family)
VIDKPDAVEAAPASRDASGGPLSGQVVVVTGSTRGIGRAIVEECGRAGASVVVSSRTPQAVEDTVAALTAEGIEAAGIAADVSRVSDLEALRDHALERFGRIHAWVNNAGLSGGYRPLDELSPEEVRAIVDVNVTGTLLACRMLVPHMIVHGGIIVNVTGRGGGGEAAPFGTVYAATKAAVTSLTKSLAEENAGLPVSIHQVLPGMVDTDFFADIEISPELESSADNIELALDCFGCEVTDVGRLVADIVAQEPGAETGKTYSALSGTARMRGVVKMIGHRASGRLKPVRRERG